MEYELFPIPGYEGIYSVSKDGRVWSLNYNNLGYIGQMKPRIAHNGYYQVTFLQKGVRKTMSVHRLVALAILDNSENKQMVNHKNTNKLDNRVENLEWCTPSENVQHAVKMVGMNCGEKQWRSKLTKEQILEIYYSPESSIDDLATKYDTSRNYIFRIKGARTWKWLLEPLNRKEVLHGV